MKLEARMSTLEKGFAAHLEQSNVIWTTLSENNTDLKWVKKAFWTLAGAMVTFNVTLVVGLVLYLVKR